MTCSRPSSCAVFSTTCSSRIRCRQPAHRSSSRHAAARTSVRLLTAERPMATSRRCRSFAAWPNCRRSSTPKRTAWFQLSLKGASDFLGAAFYLGAVHAANGRDHDAVGAWQLSLLNGGKNVYPMLVDATLRIGDGQGALELIAEAPEAWPSDEARLRRVATAQAMLGQFEPALETLHALLARRTEDNGSAVRRAAGDVSPTPDTRAAGGGSDALRRLQQALHRRPRRRSRAGGNLAPLRASVSAQRAFARRLCTRQLLSGCALPAADRSITERRAADLLPLQAT